MIQPEFKPVVDEALARCKAYLNVDFLAAYLHGSVNLGDAVAGVSDLDLFVVTKKEPSDADRAWLETLCQALRERYRVIDEAHIALTSEESLRADRFSRFALTFNAALLDGVDVAAKFTKDEPDSYLPDKRIAQMRLGFARQCLCDVLAGKQSASTGPLPENTCYAARKYARYFVVIEGAYFLMSRGRFTSFAPETVLGQLEKEAQEYAEAIALTRRVMTDPLGAGVRHEAFIREAASLVRWMLDQIENA